MVRIAVLSDTHNNQILFRKCLEREDYLDYIFHLGDFYEDLDDNVDLLKDRILVRIPGIYHQGYTDRTLPKSSSQIIEGWKILLVHDIRDAYKESRNHDIVLFGHSHKSSVELKRNIYYINPGHLKRNIDRTYEASFCILEINNQQIQITFKNPKGVILSIQTIHRQEMEDK